MIYKRGKTYWYKFMWQGKLVRESTKQRNDKVARNMESAHRTSLAKGEVWIREKTLAPTLAGFLKNDFLPYTDETFKSKPATARYYGSGAKSLQDSPLSGLRIDENQRPARAPVCIQALTPFAEHGQLRPSDPEARPLSGSGVGQD